MSDPINESSGKIMGKEGSVDDSAGKILGKTTRDNNLVEEPGAAYHTAAAATKEDRISSATRENGLQSLPRNFGNTNGDWKIIESDNLFEILYLDYRQIVSITPEIVKNNYNLLNAFWKEKKEYWEEGSARIKEDTQKAYGAKNLGECIKRLNYAYEQLSTAQGIDDYYQKYKALRIRAGEIKLASLLNLMTNDEKAEPGDIKHILKEGLGHNLNTEEIAGIIKKEIDNRQLKPYGTPSGNLLSEQLVSVSWMSEEKLKEAIAEAAAKKKAGREIFDNVYAYSVEEIGEIIFNHEKEAKRDIADGLLKNSIDYFSPAKARQFVDIVNTQKFEHLRYLQIAYRLNPQLPYRFTAAQLAGSPKDLCDMMCASPESFKLGKEQFKSGYPEVWFMETNKEAYAKLVSIRNNAESLDSAFIAFLYTFDPALPYRFDEIHLVKTSQELCFEINKNNRSWEEGKKELFHSTIPVWLSTAKQSPVASKWYQVMDRFKDKKDLGLEYFLHLLDDTLAYTKLTVDKKAITYPKIESGKVVKTDIIFTNETRGYLEASLKFSKDIPGVSLSAPNFAINNIMASPHSKASLIIDSNVLLKGVTYTTDILVTTFEQQKITIPVSFKIVFPKKAFILEIAKYSLVFSVFFIFIRFILSSTHRGWLITDYNYFLDAEQAFIYYSDFSLFGWTFFLFISCVATGIYFLVKYLFKNAHK